MKTNPSGRLDDRRNGASFVGGTVTVGIFVTASSVDDDDDDDDADAEVAAVVATVESAFFALLLASLLPDLRKWIPAIEPPVTVIVAPDNDDSGDDAGERDAGISMMLSQNAKERERK